MNNQAIFIPSPALSEGKGAMYSYEYQLQVLPFGVDLGGDDRFIHE
tara:strand:+ start:28594 stop:28731 length:138 start_codon:yes stop_codon:yes gene_type:complete